MQLVKVNLKKLKQAKYNPRKKLKPSDKEYQQLKKSIENLGYSEPIIVNKDYTVIGGHQRLNVLKDLGYTEIDVIQLDLSKDKEKALNLALNKITGKWDNIMQIVKENCSVDFSGTNPNDDLERLLHQRKGF